MKSIDKLQQELIEVKKELKLLCSEDSKLFLKGCSTINRDSINKLIVREYNIQININQLKQKYKL